MVFYTLTDAAFWNQSSMLTAPFGRRSGVGGNVRCVNATCLWPRSALRNNEHSPAILGRSAHVSLPSGAQHCLSQSPGDCRLQEAQGLHWLNENWQFALEAGRVLRSEDYVTEDSDRQVAEVFRVWRRSCGVGKRGSWSEYGKEWMFQWLERRKRIAFGPWRSYVDHSELRCTFYSAIIKAGPVSNAKRKKYLNSLRDWRYGNQGLTSIKNRFADVDPDGCV